MRHDDLPSCEHWHQRADCPRGPLLTGLAALGSAWLGGFGGWLWAAGPPAQAQSPELVLPEVPKSWAEILLPIVADPLKLAIVVVGVVTFFLMRAWRRRRMGQ